MCVIPCCEAVVTALSKTYNKKNKRFELQLTLEPWPESFIRGEIPAAEWHPLKNELPAILLLNCLPLVWLSQIDSSNFQTLTVMKLKLALDEASF